MRKLLVPIAAALVAACGSSSSSSGGGGGGGSPLTGTVGGHAFAPSQTRAVIAGSGVAGCFLGSLGITVGVKAIEIEAAAFEPVSVNTAVCDDLLASSTACRHHASSQNVRIIVAKVDTPTLGVPIPPEPAIGLEPFAVSSTLAPPLSIGTLKVGYAEALVVGPDPGYLATSEKSLDGGTVTLTAVSNAGPIAGHVAITFDKGSSISGDFSANACGGSLDVCAIANALVSAGSGLCTLPADDIP